MLIKISNHSCYDKGIISHTKNVSNIIDKMVRLAAKCTENYASDIVYDAFALETAIKEMSSFDRILFFRENGVITWQSQMFDESAYDSVLLNFTPIQTWRLTHDPITMETKLIRIDIYKSCF